MLPQFIIIGAQKSASTFIHRVVEEHPQVITPADEIPIFEQKELTQQKVEDYFANLFQEDHTGKIFGIKRPSYLGIPRCPQSIHAFVPDAKLIVVLRNPINRFMSAYFHYIKGGFSPVKDFDTGSHELLSGAWQARFPRTREIVEFGKYGKHLTNYLKYFSREQILILFHEDLLKNKEEAIKKVYVFLGIDSSFFPRKNFNKKPQSVIYSISRLRFICLRNFGGGKVSFKELSLFKKIVFTCITAIDRYILRIIFRNRKPQIEPALKRQLIEVYRKDIDIIEKIANKDLTEWKVM